MRITGTFIASSLCLLLCLLQGCAYYNTFYNAKKAFREGERIRRSQVMPDGSIPPTALTSYELAIENAGLVLRDHPESSLVDDALVLIGDAQAVQGRHEQAIRRYEQVLRLFPDSDFVAHCLFALGSSYFGDGQADRADEILDRFIREHPGSDRSPDAYMLRGEIAFNEGRYEEAVRRFEAFLETHPDDERQAEALYFIGRSNLESNRFDAARALFDRVIEHARTQKLRFQAGFMGGESLRREGRLRDALGEYEALLGRRVYEAYRPEVMLAMAACRVALGEQAEAIFRYETIINDFENDRAYTEEVSQAMYELAELYRVTGELEQAEQWYSDALRKSPRSFWVGRESDSKTRAIRDLRRLNGNLANMREALAATKIGEDGGPDEAANVGRIVENVVGLRYQLAEHYLFELSMADSALSQYNAIEKETNDPAQAARAAYARAWILDEVLDDPVQAESVYDDITARYGGTAHAVEAAIVLSKPVQGELPQDRLFAEAERLLFEADLPDSARGLYELVIRRFPDGAFAPRALFALGWLAETRFGDPESALEHYRNIVDRYPGSEQARYVRDKIRYMEEPGSVAEPDK